MNISWIGIREKEVAENSFDFLFMEIATSFWSYFSRMNEERPFTTSLPNKISNHNVPKYYLIRINIIKYVWW
jgi:hypothetical protein